MKFVLKELFQQKKRYQHNHPLFMLWKDTSLPLEHRLSFVPAIAFFVMCFGDLNRYLLTRNDESDPLQNIINVHAREDEQHWPWYVHDHQLLGYGSNPAEHFLNTTWGDQTHLGRLTIYHLIQELNVATLKEKLVIIEVMEEMGNAYFSHTVLLAQEYQQRTGLTLNYLGHQHLDHETGHAMGTDHQVLANLTITDQERARMIQIVKRVSQLFYDWAQQQLEYIQTAQDPAVLKVAEPV